MKVVITHTDFRIYWPARIEFLYNFLILKNIKLEVVEISGAGSPYYFAGNTCSNKAYWHCLYPNEKMENINPSLANKTLRLKLNELNPDIVIAGAIAFPSGAAAVRWATENKKKVIIFDDARIEDILRPRIIDWVKRKIFSCVDAVFCPSPAWDNTFAYFGFKNEQIFYGVDVVNNSFWQENSSQPKSVELPEKYILTVGRQISIKNVQLLLKAYQEYQHRIKEYSMSLVIVGEGEENNKLKSYAEKEQLYNIHFIPFQSQEILKIIYSKASVFVLPSLGEPWGLVVNEAMASGLPVLVSNRVGCASTLVKVGENGFTFSPINVDELTSLLIKFNQLSNAEKIKMGEVSLQIISEWDLAKFTTGLFDAISFVLNKKLTRINLISSLVLKIWKGRYRPI
jgi:glycosyltransferase involved in cell wall biosynthesis